MCLLVLEQLEYPDKPRPSGIAVRLGPDNSRSAEKSANTVILELRAWTSHWTQVVLDKRKEGAINTGERKDNLELVKDMDKGTWVLVNEQ